MKRELRWLTYASAPRRHERRTRVFPVALVLVLAILAAALILAWRAASPGSLSRKRLSDERAREHLAALAGGTNRIPQSLRILNAQVDEGRDSTWWYKASVDPADVPALKESFQVKLRGDVSEAVDSGALAEIVNAPPWWDPQALSDAEIVRGGQSYWFVFSRSTGLVYILYMEF